MKKSFLYYLITISLIVFIGYSCQKEYTADVNNNPADTTLNKLLGKWNLTSITISAINGPDVLRVNGQPGDILEFRNDGRVYTSIDNTSDTSAYKILADDSTIVSHYILRGVQDPQGDTITIRKLTSNLLILAWKLDVEHLALDSLRR
ncbi:MAG: hypothetical protein JWQ40_5186 [Segetibacter sp.]|nr:hypothetical protein [Segetibacter sp.]